MKRLVILVLVVIMSAGTVLQARPHHPRPAVVCHPPVVIRRVYRSSSYWHWRARKYRYETERIATVGNLVLSVADLMRAKQESDAQRELQQQKMAAEEAARKEAERQALFERASALKAKQRAQLENEFLRQEVERLKLELEKEKLQKELQDQKQK